jgi:hypothetical protein
VKGWDGLVSSALLGTDRKPPSLDELPEPVRAALGEGGLLDAAALATLYRRAGRLPLRDLSPLPSAPGQDRPLPRPAAIRRLAVMLNGFQTAVLGEWLRAAEARGWGVPPEHLPALADLARGRPEYRMAVAIAAGRRAGWLAGLNAEWRFLAEAVAGSNDLTSWSHGSAGQRRGWLLALRRRDPAAAREALASVWSAEPAAVRVDLLGILAEELSQADEDFCEAALDDRSREVRRVAARLLAQSPGSRYGDRMAERVRACLSTDSRGVLVVALPAELDASMRRDGVDLQPRQTVGQRAWWFRQLVAAAPLSTYEDLASTPAEFLRLPVEGCAPELMQAALAEATVRERSADWARALLQIEGATEDRMAELLRTLPPQEWPGAVDALRKRADLAVLVGGLPTPWPVPLGTAVLDQLTKAGTARTWARVASIAARAPEVLNHPITRQPTGEEDTWRLRLIETLIFRREMYEELS